MVDKHFGQCHLTEASYNAWCIKNYYKRVLQKRNDVITDALKKEFLGRIFISHVKCP